MANRKEEGEMINCPLAGISRGAMRQRVQEENCAWIVEELESIFYVPEAYLMGWGGGGGERYEDEVIHFVPLPSSQPFRGPLEGVGPGNRDFFGPCHFEGHWKGRALKIKTFLGPRKVSIFRAHPF
jgi:hypothetical protein